MCGRNCSLFPELRESQAVILQDRVVPASQVPFPGEPSGELSGFFECNNMVDMCLSASVGMIF